MGVHEACVGDLDQDDGVSLSDLTTMLSCFGLLPGCPGGACCEADLDGSDDIDVQDLSILLSRYGTICHHESGNGVAGGGEEAARGENSLDEWIRSATIEQILDWWQAGMPPIGGDR